MSQVEASPLQEPLVCIFKIYISQAEVFIEALEFQKFKKLRVMGTRLRVGWSIRFADPTPLVATHFADHVRTTTIFLNPNIAVLAISHLTCGSALGPFQNFFLDISFAGNVFVGCPQTLKTVVLLADIALALSLLR